MEPNVGLYHDININTPVVVVEGTVLLIYESSALFRAVVRRGIHIINIHIHPMSSCVMFEHIS